MAHAIAAATDDEIPASIFQRRWYILGVLCTSLMVVTLANTSMNVALPTMSEALHLTASDQQWVIDAYSLVFAGLLFTAGTLGDRLGRKGFLQAGLVVFGAASAYATFFASSAGELIVTRALMGVGGALVMPATLSILVNAFPSGERAKAIAIWTAVAGGGGAAGLLLGGWLVEHFWWGSTFAMNLPVVAVSLLIGARLLPTSKDPHPGRLDPLGAVLSMAGIGLLVLGLIEAPHWGWGSTTTLATIGTSIAVLAGFVLWELRIDEPMLDVRLFRNRNFGVSSLGITLVFLTMFGFFFVVSQLFQLVLGYGPFESGLRLFPLMPLLMVFTPMSPVLARRIGTRNLVTLGMLLTAGGVFILSFLHADSTYLFVLSGMTVMAAGMGLTMTPMTDLIMSSVPRDKAGMSSAMNDTTRELGGALGVAVLGSVLASGYASHLGGAVDGLPAPAAATARESLGGALAVGQQLGGSAGQALVEAARSAWTSGLHTSLTLGTVIIVVAAAISYFFLPSGADEVEVAEAFDEALDAFVAGELVTNG